MNQLWTLTLGKGGKQTLDIVKEKGLEEQLETLFENSFDLTEPIEETTVNDWLWHEVNIEDLEEEEEEE